MTILCRACVVLVAFGWRETECTDCRHEAAQTAEKLAA